MTQKCAGCGVQKPLAEFYKNSAKKNGRDSKCKECRRARHKAYRELRKEELNAVERGRYRQRRDDILLQKKAHYQENRDEILGRRREYMRRPDVQERHREYMARYVGVHVDRLRLQRRERRASVNRKIFELLGFSCSVCGESDSRLLTLDHLLNNGAEERRKHGGSLGLKLAILDGRMDIANYRILCHSCNVGRYQLNPVNHWKSKPLSRILKKCPTCLQEKDISCFHSWGSRSGKGWVPYYECGSCKSFRRWTVKLQCLRQLGGSCAVCGEKSPYKLTVDHADNDGGLRRPTDRSGESLYRKILNGSISSSGLQVLCFNCNYAKSLFQYDSMLVFNPKSISVIQAEKEDAQDFLDGYHYAGYGRSGSCSFGAVLNGLLIAVAKFAPPVRKEVATSMGIDYREVLELDRLCVKPGFNAKNLLSYFLSRVVKLIRSDSSEVTTLVSFADPRFGHDGTAYRASNWEYIGKTARSYFYLSPDGEEVHKKTLYNFAKRRGMGEREYADQAGYRRVHVPPKLKFAYRL